MKCAAAGADAGVAAWAADQQAKGVKDAVPVLRQLTTLVDAAQNPR